MTRERHEGHRGARGSHEGVAAHFRLHAGVRGRTAEAVVELRRAEELFRGRHDRAARNVASEVTAVEKIDVVDDAALGHRTRTAHAFFGGLKEKLERSAEFVLVFGKPLGEREAHGLVAVVAAGVHVARTAGGEAFAVREMIGVRRFRDGHAVEFEADRHDGTGTARFQQPHNASDAVKASENFFLHALALRKGEALFDLTAVGASDEVGIDDFAAALDGKAERLEFFDHARRRDEFGPAWFGLGVDFTAQSGDGFLRKGSHENFSLHVADQ